MPSMFIRALLISLVVVCAAPVATHAEPTAAPAPSAPPAGPPAAPARPSPAARQPLRRPIDARRPALQAGAGALTALHRRCVPRAGEIYAVAGNGTYEVWTALTRYEDFDDMQQALRPVASDVRAHIARLVRLHTGDRVIDRAARAQARMLRWMLALPSLDTCAMGAEWRSHHFDPKSAPAAMRTLDDVIETAPLMAVASALESGRRRLRRLGVNAHDAARALDFPDGAVPLARPAQQSFVWHDAHSHGRIDRDGSFGVHAGTGG